MFTAALLLTSFMIFRTHLVILIAKAHIHTRTYVAPDPYPFLARDSLPSRASHAGYLGVRGIATQVFIMPQNAALHYAIGP